MLLDNPPPNNPEIEQSVLAGCIFSTETLFDVISILSEADFYRQSHALIFKALVDLHSANAPVDVVILAEKLRSCGNFEKIGGGAYLSHLLDCPVPVDIFYHAEKLKKLAQLRNIIHICVSTVGKCNPGAVYEVDELINEFQTKALSVGKELTPSFVTKKELTLESIDRYERLNRGDSSKILKTGYPTIDRLIGGGFKGSELIIIAARPGVGKTALMCNMVRNMAVNGVSCGVFSLEMDRGKLDDRWIGMESGVNIIRLSGGKGPDESDWKSICETADRQQGWNVFVDDTGGLAIGELKRRARQMVHAGADVIFIDQLSKIGGKRNASIYERNTEHVEELGFFKKEIRRPIVLLAQLNRELEKRNEKKPILSDLKNTGQLEEEADIVLLGYRPSLYNPAVDETLAEWDIAKNRQGGLYSVKMYWHGKTQKFLEAAPGGQEGRYE